MTARAGHCTAGLRHLILTSCWICLESPMVSPPGRRGRSRSASPGRTRPAPSTGPRWPRWPAPRSPPRSSPVWRTPGRTPAQQGLAGTGVHDGHGLILPATSIRSGNTSKYRARLAPLGRMRRDRPGGEQLAAAWPAHPDIPLPPWVAVLCQPALVNLPSTASAVGREDLGGRQGKPSHAE
jgi:hypothetical protein